MCSWLTTVIWKSLWHSEQKMDHGHLNQYDCINLSFIRFYDLPQIIWDNANIKFSTDVENALVISLLQDVTYN